MISNDTIEQIKNFPAKNKRETNQKNKMVEVAGKIQSGEYLWPAMRIIADDIVSPKAKYPEGVDVTEMTAINAHILIDGGRSIDSALEILGIEV